MCGVPVCRYRIHLFSPADVPHVRLIIRSALRVEVNISLTVDAVSRIKSQVGTRTSPPGCWRRDPGAPDPGRPKVGFLPHPQHTPRFLSVGSSGSQSGENLFLSFIFLSWCSLLVSGRETLSREFCMCPLLAEMVSDLCQLEEAHASITMLP